MESYDRQSARIALQIAFTYEGNIYKLLKVFGMDAARSLRSLRIFLRNKLVASPVNGSYKNRIAWIFLDFLPQFRDAIVYSPVTTAFPFWPRRVYEPLARHHDFRSGNQKLQHFEFTESYPNRLTTATQLHLSEIQRDISKLLHVPDSLALKI